MNNKDQKAKEIFLQLISNVPPEDWEERVIAASAGDEDLCERVRALLRAHVVPDSVLDEPPPIDQSEPTLPLAAIEMTSAQIGPYKLLQQIGEGGMGVVYMAEQKVPVSRRVALKIIRPGMDTRQVIARFEAERQALAMMDHPNIAKVLDAGTTDQGSPYFVMELVQGIPLTRYCDQNKLSISERLELFIPVCQAVQHAHQKGIIHRDLKPSNVLVCLYDGRPVAKVIDFGLAKALQQQTKLTDKTMFTEFGQVVGTLQYMSPEQAEMNQLDVDTRTDIYSLGVMLYELLTGSTPIDQETLKQQAILQVLATIREKEPPRPSVRLGSSANDVIEGISQQRQIDPIKLQSILRGELDWIVMKALEKDRTRRYDTASNFAKDIENYLTGNVVAARPPSTAYRFSKYVRKHKGLVGSMASIAVLLVAGIIGTSIGFDWANRARLEAVKARFDADQKTEEVLVEKRKADNERIRAENEKSIADAILARSNYFLALSRWNENRVREAYELLDRIPPSYRYTEWYLARSQFQGGHLTCYGLEPFARDWARGVTSVGFHPDGKLVVTGGCDGTLTIWNAVTGQELLTLGAHSDHVNCVSFSPDGKKIASGSYDETVVICDAVTGEIIHTLKGHIEDVWSIAFSYDGTKIFSGSKNGTVKVWETLSGKNLQTIQAHHKRAHITASPDGESVISASEDGILTVWDSSSGKKKREIGNKTEWYLLDGITSLALNWSATRTVTGHRDGTIKHWDLTTGKELQTFQRHAGSVLNIAFSPDGTMIASADEDGIIKVEDASTGKELHTLKGHLDCVSDIAFSPDGVRIASASADGTLKLWNLTTGGQMQILSDPDNEWIGSVVYSPDGTKLIDTSLTLWDVSSGRVLYSLKGHADISDVVFSPDGSKIVSASRDGTIKIWDAVLGEELIEFNENGGPVYCLAYSPDGSKIASGDMCGTITIWDAVTGVKVKDFGSSTSINSIAFSPDGQRIVTAGAADEIVVWDVESGQKTGPSLGLHSFINSYAAFSPDGTLIVSANEDGTIKLWDALSGEELQTAPMMHAFGVSEVCFNPDGSRMVSAGRDRTLKLWETATGQELLAFKESEELTCVAFNPDGSGIAAGAGLSLKIWFAAETQGLRALTGHANWVGCAVFSPDDTRIVSGSDDGTLKIWDAAIGQVLLTVRGHTGGVLKVAFSPDGLRFASIGWDRTLKLWDTREGRELGVVRDLPEESYPLTMAFSDDGEMICLKYRNGNGVNWNITSNRIDPAHSWKGTSGEKTISNDSRWALYPVRNSIILYDLLQQEKASERFALNATSARLNVHWHRELSLKAQDSFAALFHLAWIMKYDPDDPVAYDKLHEAHAKWLAEWNEQQNQTVELSADDIKEKKREKLDPNQVLPQSVREMLSMPRGTKEPPD